MFIKQLTTAECFKVLTEKRMGRLACARENQPYVVPFHFAFDGSESLYAFSTFGQKIEWMRANPQVCVELDDIKTQFAWTSLVIFGHFEELSETLEFEEERIRAHGYLSNYPMWWQPAFVKGAHQLVETVNSPIYFRILIDRITGHRAVSDEVAEPAYTRLR